MEKFIELQNVTLESGGHRILDDITLTIPLGRTTFILGPSGSGKSSLVKVIAGLLDPSAGSVLVLGRDYQAMDYLESKIFRSSAGFIFQDAALWANQTVWNNLLIPLRHHYPNMGDDEARYRIESLLRRLGYRDSPSLRPSDLSAGEQKVVAFARGIILDPQVIFMDEPASFMDEAGARIINGLIRELATAGKTIVAAGNLYQLAFRIADYLCILEGGKVHRMDTIHACAESWPDFLEPMGEGHRRTLEKRRAEAERT